jgi:hypothetical protein
MPSSTALVAAAGLDMVCHPVPSHTRITDSFDSNEISAAVPSMLALFRPMVSVPLAALLRMATTKPAPAAATVGKVHVTPAAE